ncbi:YgfZ/GcvT domain-containing protein [Parvularcula oceani]|uniref:CAF17-like 4Fe-4S cluster assembly/insertion protein YgfZ n=1 Tax=Parvularcula oceani TaxID=1247963 RepID=UPI0004E10013|nr:folate-binding protein YgfZ [Parvularcula oceani]
MPDLPALPPTVLPGRAVLSLTGEETVPFLQGLLTANLEKLSSGGVTHTALLTPQGKVLSAFFVWRREDGVLIDAAPGEAQPLLQRLRLYKLRAKVEIEDVSGRFAVVVSGDGEAADPRLAALGARRLCEEDAEKGDPDAYEARRIALGVPEFGADYGSGEVFPMDVNLDALGAVDYKKGCFVGQEVASRMFRKGEVRKRSWRVLGEGPLPKGAPVTAGGSTLGTVTSSHGGSGIALLRVDRAQRAEEAPQVEGLPVTLLAPDYLS